MYSVITGTSLRRHTRIQHEGEYRHLARGNTHAMLIVAHMFIVIYQDNVSGVAGHHQTKVVHPHTYHRVSNSGGT